MLPWSLKFHTCESAKTATRLRRRKTVAPWGWWMDGRASHWSWIQKNKGAEGIQAAVLCAQNHFKSFSHLLSEMKLIWFCIPPRHLRDSAWQHCLFGTMEKCCMHDITIILLRTAGVCFLNNNPHPARALRNVITVNLSGTDHPGDKCASL